jgi:hypothetical protein
MLFSTCRAAEECVSFIICHSNSAATSRGKVRTMHTVLTDSDHASGSDRLYLFVVIFPSYEWKNAKLYWQHAGSGISSRYAEACLRSHSSRTTFSDICDGLCVTKLSFPSWVIFDNLCLNTGAVNSTQAN